MLIQVLSFLVSVTLTVLFFIYGFNHYYLLNASRRYRLPKVKMPSDNIPSVCIHLPIYNEKYVVRRLVNACVSMADHYDRSKVRLLLLDDSTDDTYDETRKIAAEYRPKALISKFSIVKTGRASKPGLLRQPSKKPPRSS